MKPIRMLTVLLSLLVLSGCTFPSGDDLLAAPKPSTNYQTLQAELEELIASGISYTAPVEGENRSSIRLTPFVPVYAPPGIGRRKGRRERAALLYSL